MRQQLPLLIYGPDGNIIKLREKIAVGMWRGKDTGDVVFKQVSGTRLIYYNVAVGHSEYYVYGSVSNCYTV